MLIECLLLIVGLALVVLGADFLVDGASSIAKKFGVSDFVIGLTIVGMGTSAPEMVVSFIGALQGNGDIAIGNVVGSNIFNVFMILGATALILPMDITPMNRKKDIPLNIAITLIFIALGMSRTLFGIGDDVLGRLDGAILLVLFAAYIYMCFRFDTANQTETNENEKVIKPALAAVLIVAGLAGLVFGGRMFVNSATSIAKMLNVSDKLIAITILAGGTSMPELVTCIVAAFKKKGQLALGGSALIHPLSMAGMSYVDLGALLLSSLVIWASIHTNKKNQLDRADGLLLLLLEAAYMTFLIIKK